MAFNKKKAEERIMDIDASMQGNLSFREPVNLRINGKFEGNLETRGNLIIGNTAIVNADITGDNIIIGGKVTGKIVGRARLTFLPTAIVEANIYTAKLNIAEGAIFEGRCSMLHDFLNCEELSQYLEVDLNSIIDWARSGKVPAIRDGDNWRFERKAIDSWIASGKV